MNKKIYEDMRRMLKEIEFFASANPEYLEQTDFENELSDIYQSLLEFGQSHLPSKDRTF